MESIATRCQEETRHRRNQESQGKATMTEAREYERSHYEAVMDVRYFARLHFLHINFYRRINYIVSALSLVSGTAAYSSAINGSPALLTASGVLVALFSAIGVLCNFPEKIVQHRLLYRRYKELDATAKGMSLDSLDEKIKAISMDEDGVVKALELRAFNDNVISAGRTDYAEQLPLISRAVSLIV